MSARFNRFIRAFVIFGMAGVLAGCGSHYVAPTDAPETLATVRGPIMTIEGKRVAEKILGVVSSEPVQVGPGPRRFSFGNYFTDLNCTLQIEAGNSYEFALETYLDTTRLKMNNETTHRITYFDATKQIFYDDANQLLPKPNGPFAP